MKFVPYINYNGDCRQAFEFYKEVLGGELMLVTHEQMPEAVEEMEKDTGLDWKDKILNAQLSHGEFVIMGSDTPPDWYSPPQSMYVSLMVDTPEDAERVFAAFADGGAIEMPLEEQPWAYRFGLVKDRYGTPWMINCLKPMP